LFGAAIWRSMQFVMHSAIHRFAFIVQRYGGAVFS
jgi:hypothetical protein